MVRFLTLAPVFSVTTGPAAPLTILTTPRSGNAAYALPLRVLRTTPLGPSVTPTSARSAAAAARMAASTRAARRRVVCRGTDMWRILPAIGCAAACLLADEPTFGGILVDRPRANRGERKHLKYGYAVIRRSSQGG